MKIKFFLLFSILSIIVFAQKSEYKYANYIHKKDTLNYRVLKPLDFDTNKKYPLVLFLHGFGERGNDNEKQLIHGSKLFAKRENREKHPAFVIFPQAPLNDSWSSRVLKKENKKRLYSFPDDIKPTKSLQLVMQLMDSLVTTKNIDTNRVYITGLSNGGMGTFEILANKPKMFAAAAPICGGGNTKKAAKYAKNTAIWVFHGAKDRTVYPIYSVKMVESLLNEGGNPRFTLYENVYHSSWNNAFAEDDFLDWLFSKSLFKE